MMISKLMMTADGSAELQEKKNAYDVEIRKVRALVDEYTKKSADFEKNNARREREHAAAIRKAKRGGKSRSSGKEGDSSASSHDEDYTKQMAQLIDKNMTKENGQPFSWKDVVGLEDVKEKVKTNIIKPMKGDGALLWKGPILTPLKGMLLYGPPGCGKTHIAKVIASQCGVALGNKEATFFCLSPSDVNSMYRSKPAKMVQALFKVAREKAEETGAPSIIFIDEIDNILSKRSSSGKDSNAGLKNEFLIQTDGAKCKKNDKVFLIGATNLPEKIDEAMMSRFPIQMMVPLPDSENRLKIIQKKLDEKHPHAKPHPRLDPNGPHKGKSHYDTTNGDNGVTAQWIAEQAEGMSFRNLDGLMTKVAAKANQNNTFEDRKLVLAGKKEFLAEFKDAVRCGELNNEYYEKFKNKKKKKKSKLNLTAPKISGWFKSVLDFFKPQALQDLFGYIVVGFGIYHFRPFGNQSISTDPQTPPASSTFDYGQLKAIGTSVVAGGLVAGIVSYFMKSKNDNSFETYESGSWSTKRGSNRTQGQKDSNLTGLIIGLVVIVLLCVAAILVYCCLMESSQKAREHLGRSSY